MSPISLVTLLFLPNSGITSSVSHSLEARTMACKFSCAYCMAKPSRASRIGAPERPDVLLVGVGANISSKSFHLIEGAPQWKFVCPCVSLAPPGVSIFPNCETYPYQGAPVLITEQDFYDLAWS